MNFCESCGGSLSPEARYCSHCGDAVEPHYASTPSSSAARAHGTTVLKANPVLRGLSTAAGGLSRASRRPEIVRLFVAFVIVVMLTLAVFLTWHFTHTHQVCYSPDSNHFGSQVCHTVSG